MPDEPKKPDAAPSTPPARAADAKAPAPAVDSTAELLAFLKTQKHTGMAVGPTKALDKTIPGGKYLVQGVWRNADGEEINEDGSLKHPGEMVKDAFGRLVPRR